MPLDPQCRKVIDMLAASGAPPMEQQTHLELRAGRAAAAEAIADMAGPAEPMAKVEDRTLPGPAGDIPYRLYVPLETAGSPAPLIVYFHGGGWVIGSAAEWDRTCRLLAADAGAILMSVDYRLAPEDKFPAAADDAFAAFQWAAQNTASLGADPNRVVVAGDSAGGNLATVCCIMARDRIANGEPAAQARFQLLVYPVIDHSDDSPSMTEFATDHFLSRAAMEKFWEYYLNSPADGVHPYASPAKADLAGLPPALILTAECDPLRDQGEAYAAQLNAAGCKAHVIRYDGAMHAFFSMAGVIASGRRAIADAGKAVREAVGS